MMMEAYPLHQHLKTHRYGIVDATLREELDDAWPQIVIAPKFLGDDTSRCPVLVDISGIEDDTRYSLFDTLIANTKASNETFFSLLLASEKPLEQVAAHLADRLKIQLKPSERPMQFRYFDPGTFLQLPNLLSDAGMAWLMGPVDSVLVPWLGDFSVQEKPKGRGFAFRPKHIDGLYRIGVANRVLNSRRTPLVASQQAWISSAKRMYVDIERALAYQLDELDDIATFCLHAMAYHTEFDQHPMIQNIFKQLATRTDEEVDLNFTDLISEVSRNDWKTIVHELEQTEEEHTGAER